MGVRGCELWGYAFPVAGLDLSVERCDFLQLLQGCGAYSGNGIDYGEGFASAGAPARRSPLALIEVLGRFVRLSARSRR